MKTSKEAVPSTPKADRISIYDRDRRSMGQLINSERFVSSTKDGPTYEFKKTNEGLTITRNGCSVIFSLISISVAKFFLTTSFC